MDNHEIALYIDALVTGSIVFSIIALWAVIAYLM